METRNPKAGDTKVPRAPRLLLGFSSLVLVFGGVAHAAAFRRALATIAVSNLPPFIANSFKALWLGDSTTCLILAAVFGSIAARPSVATAGVVVLLALVPAAIAVLIYVFLGSFYAGHVMLAAAAAVFLAGLQFPGGRLSWKSRELGES